MLYDDNVIWFCNSSCEIRCLVFSRIDAGNGMARPAEQIRHRNEITQACRTQARPKLTDVNGFTVRFFRNVIFLSVNLLATIWPLIKILRSLVVYVNQHNKDYLGKIPCDCLCGDDAAFVNYFDLLFSHHVQSGPKTGTRPTFCDNFGKCTPIFTILSPADS